MNTRLCSIPDCGGALYASGWCQKHYMRWYHHGDPLKTVRTPPLVHRYDGTLCSVDGCGLVARQRGWCRLHYKRWRRLGSPTAPARRRPNGSFYPGAEYLVGTRGGRRVLAHRVVMEEHLGRPLADDEHVHHINGDKHDNRIENLEVLTPSEHARRHKGTSSKVARACGGIAIP